MSWRNNAPVNSPNAKGLAGASSSQTRANTNKPPPQQRQQATSPSRSQKLPNRPESRVANSEEEKRTPKQPVQQNGHPSSQQSVKAEEPLRCLTTRRLYAHVKQAIESLCTSERDLHLSWMQVLQHPQQLFLDSLSRLERTGQGVVSQWSIKIYSSKKRKGEAVARVIGNPCWQDLVREAFDPSSATSPYFEEIFQPLLKRREAKGPTLPCPAPPVLISKQVKLLVVCQDDDYAALLKDAISKGLIIPNTKASAFETQQRVEEKEKEKEKDEVTEDAYPLLSATKEFVVITHQQFLQSALAEMKLHDPEFPLAWGLMSARPALVPLIVSYMLPLIDQDMDSLKRVVDVLFPSPSTEGDPCYKDDDVILQLVERLTPLRLRRLLAHSPRMTEALGNFVATTNLSEASPNLLLRVDAVIDALGIPLQLLKEASPLEFCRALLNAHEGAHQTIKKKFWLKEEDGKVALCYDKIEEIQETEDDDEQQERNEKKKRMNEEWGGRAAVSAIAKAFDFDSKDRFAEELGFPSIEDLLPVCVEMAIHLSKKKEEERLLSFVSLLLLSPATSAPLLLTKNLSLLQQIIHALHSLDGGNGLGVERLFWGEGVGFSFLRNTQTYLPTGRPSVWLYLDGIKDPELKDGVRALYKLRLGRVEEFKQTYLSRGQSKSDGLKALEKTIGSAMDVSWLLFAQHASVYVSLLQALDHPIAPKPIHLSIEKKEKEKGKGKEEKKESEEERENKERKEQEEIEEQRKEKGAEEKDNQDKEDVEESKKEKEEKGRKEENNETKEKKEINEKGVKEKDNEEEKGSKKAESLPPLIALAEALLIKCIHEVGMLTREESMYLQAITGVTVRLPSTPGHYKQHKETADPIAMVMAAFKKAKKKLPWIVPRMRLLSSGQLHGENILIEGDSLLLWLLSQDPVLRLSFSAGGSVLQAVAAVESLLHSIAMRGHKFFIVFFRIHRILWADSPALLLLREILRRHLSSIHTDAIKGRFLEFDSCGPHDRAWSDWRSEFDPVYVFSGNGHPAYHFFTCLWMEQTVLLLPSIKLPGADIQATQLSMFENDSYTSAMQAAYKVVEEQHLASLSNLQLLMLGHDQAKHLAQVIQSFEWEKGASSQSSPRTKLMISAVCMALACQPQSAVFEGMGKAIVMASIAQDSMSLQQRAFELYEEDMQQEEERQLASFMRQVCAALLYLLGDDSWDQTRHLLDDPKALVDLYDMRLVFLMWDNRKTNGILDDEDAWNAVPKTMPLLLQKMRENGEGIKGNLFTSTTRVDTVSVVSQQRPLGVSLVVRLTKEERRERREKEREVFRGHKIGIPVLEEYLSDIDRVLMQGSELVTSPPKRGEELKCYEGDYHWHSGRKRRKGDDAWSCASIEELNEAAQFMAHSKGITKTDFDTSNYLVERRQLHDVNQQRQKRATQIEQSKQQLLKALDFYFPPSPSPSPSSLKDPGVPSNVVVMELMGLAIKAWKALLKDPPLCQHLVSTLAALGANALTSQLKNKLPPPPPTLTSQPQQQQQPQKKKPGKKKKRSKKGKSKGVEADFDKQQRNPTPELAISLVEWQLGVHSDLIRWADVEDLEGRPKDIDTKEEELGFLPDGWQCKAVQVLRDERSCLILAPTGSGKTFISLEIIRTVLLGSDRDIVVVVAPTKALVNQIYVEIKAKFAKTYKDSSNMVGIFTADIKFEKTNSQVLVTNPECLEILLLSHTEEDWRRRLKYVIFDEVHQVQEEGQGPVWEHCLSMVPCPFFGLSATLGEEESFASWLRLFDNDLELIHHKKRITELQYFLYQGESFISIHPLAFLNNPDELPSLAFHAPAMLPFQTLQLYALMKKHFKPLERSTPILSSLLNDLAPNNFFKDSGFPISRRRVRKYDRHLRKALVTIHQNSLLEEKGCLLANALNVLWEEIRMPYKSGYQAIKKSNNKENSTSYLWMMDMVTNLDKHLARDDMLPALVFVISKSAMEKLFRAVIVRREEDIRAGIRTAKNEECIPYLESIRESTFVKFKAESIEDWLLRGLKCGVGLHHSNVPLGYRLLIERLFRSRKLDMIITAGTLAMGVHLPCKTVVVASYNMFVTTAFFQQMCGRAGRRGYDNIGNIVFFGINAPRVEHLATSHLPALYGRLPLSSTFILRVVILLTLSPSKANDEAVLKMLDTPFLCHGKQLFKEAIKHHVRFSLEFLIRSGFIKHDERERLRVMNESGIVSHLFFEESAVLLLVFLLRKGILNQCSKRDILAVILQVFSGLIVPHRDLSWMKRQKTYRAPNNPTLPAMHRIINESLLPSGFHQAVEEYNDNVFYVFGSYIREYAQHIDSPTAPRTSPPTQDLSSTGELPLSKLSYCVHPSAAAQKENENENEKEKEKEKEKDEGKEKGSNDEQEPRTTYACVCRSPFSALGGWDDRFLSVDDLAVNFRTDVVLEPTAIPLWQPPNMGARSAAVLDLLVNPYLEPEDIRWHRKEAIKEDMKAVQRILAKLQTALIKIEAKSDYGTFIDDLSAIKRDLAARYKALSSMSEELKNKRNLFENGSRNDPKWEYFDSVKRWWSDAKSVDTEHMCRILGAELEWRICQSKESPCILHMEKSYLPQAKGQFSPFLHSNNLRGSERVVVLVPEWDWGPCLGVWDLPTAATCSLHYGSMACISNVFLQEEWGVVIANPRYNSDDQSEEYKYLEDLLHKVRSQTPGVPIVMCAKGAKSAKAAAQAIAASKDPLAFTFSVDVVEDEKEKEKEKEKGQQQDDPGLAAWWNDHKNWASTEEKEEKEKEKEKEEEEKEEQETEKEKEKEETEKEKEEEEKEEDGQMRPFLWPTVVDVSALLPSQTDVESLFHQRIIALEAALAKALLM